MEHLLSMDSLSSSDIVDLIAEANHFQMRIANHSTILPHLKQHFLVNLFFENSTRTRSSFQIAALRLGCEVLTVDSSTSSVLKGESLRDTLLTYQAMGVDYLVIRHPEAKVLDTLVPEILTRTQVINAGDGTHEHPTQ